MDNLLICRVEILGYTDSAAPDPMFRSVVIAEMYYSMFVRNLDHNFFQIIKSVELGNIR